LRLNLIIQFADGSRTTIATDEKWKINPDGAIRSNNEYDGETYDARKAFANWTIVGYDDSPWQNAERTAIPQGVLRGAMTPNMKIWEQLSPKSLTKKGDKLIIDMGQNMAGWLKIRMSALQVGDSVVIRFAERLDSSGNIWVENFRHAQSTDRLLCQWAGAKYLVESHFCIPWLPLCGDYRIEKCQGGGFHRRGRQ
jgi:Alpha-L-rhamnosidase N-terminal domain./Bacterial alpha-L-rhamnosidase.